LGWGFFVVPFIIGH